MDSAELLPAILHGRAYMNYKINTWSGRAEMMIKFDDMLNQITLHQSEVRWEFPPREQQYYRGEMGV